MASAANVITWFEIPALDFERAVKFYEAIFATTLRRDKIGASEMAIFPYDDESAVSGCITKEEEYRPSADGAVVYLVAGNDLNTVLNRVKQSGGKVARGKTALPPGMGFYSHFIDCEGNRVGLWSPN